MQTEDKLNQLIIKDVAEWLSQECWSDHEVVEEIKDSWGLDTALARELFYKGKLFYQEQVEIGEVL